MALLVICPNCKQRLTFGEHMAGKEVQCPGCMNDVKVVGSTVPDGPQPKPAVGKVTDLMEALRASVEAARAKRTGDAAPVEDEAASEEREPRQGRRRKAG